LNRYLAAKVYYFGVQGGIHQFEEYITKTGLLKTRIIRIIDTSKKINSILSINIFGFLFILDVKREIIEITRSVT